VIDQLAIACTGVTAVWLSQDKRDHWRKWSPVFGLMSQPFWFYAAWTAEQWGIFALCFLYMLSWMRGFKAYWL
jgi:hypothetical protein